MTQNIEQRTEVAVTRYEGAATTADELVHQDKVVTTPAGKRDSFPKISRESKFKFDNQLVTQDDEFQKRFAISQNAIPWQSNLAVSNKFQRYYTGAKGTESYAEHLPEPSKLPFETGATFENDVTNGYWIEHGVASVPWTEDHVNNVVSEKQDEITNTAIWPRKTRESIEIGQVLTIEANALRVNGVMRVLSTVMPIGSVIEAISTDVVTASGIDYRLGGQSDNAEVLAAGALLPRKLSEIITDIINVASFLAPGMDIGDAITKAASKSGVVLINGLDLIQNSQAVIPDNRILIFSNGAKVTKSESLLNVSLFKFGNDCTVLSPFVDGNFRNFSNQSDNDVTVGSTFSAGANFHVIGGSIDDSESSHVSGELRGLVLDNVDLGDYQDHFVYSSMRCWDIAINGGIHVTKSGREAYKFRGSIGNVIISGQSRTECVDSILSIELETIGSLVGNGFGTFRHENVGLCRGKYYALAKIENGLNRFDEFITDVDFTSTETEQKNMRAPVRKNESEGYPFYRLTFNGGKMKNVLPQPFFINDPNGKKHVYRVNKTVFDSDVKLESSVITYGGEALTNVDVFYDAIESKNFTHERRIDNVNTFKAQAGSISGDTWVFDLRGGLDQGYIGGLNVRASLSRNLVNTRELTGQVNNLTIIGNNIKCSSSFKLIDPNSNIRHLVAPENSNVLDCGNIVKSQGTTAERPEFANGVRDGYEYLDVTLGCKITRFSTGWIDGMGNFV
ncbi:hypothetical protein LQH81_004692 [Vibrio parahaemolyticus]|nr:hypothetical protein [Vibrio parahaemolyticus]